MAAKLSAAQIGRLNKDFAPTAQEVGLGTAIDELQDYAPVILSYTVAADATAGLTAFTAPFAMKVDMIMSQSTVGEASNTWQVLSGTNQICTALAGASDGAVSYVSAGMTAATETDRTLAAGDTLIVKAAGGSNGADQRGVITIIGHRL